MKVTVLTKLRYRIAFTKVELLVVIVMLAVGVAMLMPALARAKAKANRISCVGNLKNVGLTHRIFATDNAGSFPWQLSTNRSEDGKIGPGTKEFAMNPADLWRHFAILSNMLSTPKIVVCYSEKERRVAMRWTNFNNQNLSYFLGLGASEDGAVLDNRVEEWFGPLF